MTFALVFMPDAEKQLAALVKDKGLAKRLKAVRRALGLLEVNPRHPGLHTHKYHSLVGAEGIEVLQSYAENQTSAAYRVFWCYGPEKNCITIIAITPHP